MFTLGRRHLSGQGVALDHDEGLRWTRAAAAAGEPLAMFVLGQCYRHGVGVATDLDAAAQWFSQAAANGYADAERVLAELRAIRP
jgi:TPR repeat protein